jgi:hypothetical protein
VYLNYTNNFNWQKCFVSLYQQDYIHVNKHLLELIYSKLKLKMIFQNVAGSKHNIVITCDIKLVIPVINDHGFGSYENIII